MTYAPQFKDLPLEQRIFGLAVGVVLAGLVQAVFQIPSLRGEGFRYHWVSPWNDPTVREVVKKMIPGSTGVATSDGDEYPTYTYTRRIARGGAEIIVGVSASLDFTATLGAVELSATPTSDGLETVVVRSAVPLSTQPRQFFRLSASLPSN